LNWIITLQFFQLVTWSNNHIQNHI
jgi:hypothetical protein